MNKVKWLVASMVAGMMAVSAGAEWERTVSAWDARLPAQGKIQASLWGGYWTWGEDGVDGTDMDATLYVNYGIADNWSVGVAPSFYSWDVDGGDSESGLSDTGLMSTYRFMDEADAGFDFAAMGRVSLPTGDDDDGLGTGSVEPGLVLIAAKTLGPIVAVANAGATLILDADDGEEDFVVFASLEGIYPLTDKLSVNGTFSLGTSRAEDGDEPVDIGLGARFRPMEQFFVGGAAYVCLTDDYDWGGQIACGYEF